ncbi:MAG TPA: M23 family peptidase, partial [Candidatus Eisenbacteria bacterium]
MRAARRGVVLGLLLLVPTGVRGADRGYHAPIAATCPVSSSFGEYRANHFHGGLDFSTSGEVGLPIHAIADGWVWRVRASGSGYGRALYVRLADGRTQVTAHQSRFAPAIAAFVAAAQESLDRYEVDLSPGEGRLPVKRGEIIAWSGES